MGLTLANLRSIVKRAETVLEDINRLRGTRLVTYSAACRWLQPGDLLRNQQPPDDAFQGLMQIAQFGARIGAKKKPQRSEMLEHLYAMIFERTRRWYDSEVADLMSALGLRPDSQEALKKWRVEHGMTNRLVRRKFPI